MFDEAAKNWLGKLTKLNPNIAKPGSALRGKAPHKLLLLLSLLDMAKREKLPPARSKIRPMGCVSHCHTDAALRPLMFSFPFLS